MRRSLEAQAIDLSKRRPMKSSKSLSEAGCSEGSEVKQEEEKKVMFNEQLVAKENSSLKSKRRVFSDVQQNIEEQK